MANVMLNIKGSHREVGGEEDVMELITTGTIEKVDNDFVLEYDEGELSGMGDTLTRIKIKDDCVHLERVGDMSTEFVFYESRAFEGLYTTPLGTINVSIFPTNISTNVSEDEGVVDLQYEIKVAGVAALNKLNISYKVKN